MTEDGRLWKQTIPLPSVPKTDPACAQGGGAVPMDVISIEKPEKVTRVFIAFSEYPWIKEVFQKYATSSKLRSERMQVIMPATWIKTGSGMFGMQKGEAGHATVATQAGIDQIVEYQPGLKADLLAPPAKPIAVDEYGRATDDTIWEQEATRYPLHIRQTSPSGSASKDLVKLMNEIGENAGGEPHKPMLLALRVKAGLGVASGTAFVIDAISTAAPLFKKLAARSGNRVLVMAVETVASRAAVVTSLRAVSMLITWEATIGLFALQALADTLTPDELESWCSRCVFGPGKEAILRVKDHGVEKYTEMEQQEKAFDKAMTEMA